jgi:hypothetical protein
MVKSNSILSFKSVIAVENDSLKPKMWGWHTWELIHLVSFLYPQTPTTNIKTIYKTFYELLANVIPCEKCRKSFAILINDTHKLTPEILESKDNLIKWTYDIHLQTVKELNGKNPYDTYDNFLNIFKKILKSNTRTSEAIWLTLHAITLGFPTTPTNTHIKVYKEFFTLLKYTIPNIPMRRMYGKIINSGGLKFDLLYLKNKSIFSYYLYNVHQKISTKNNMVQFPYSSFNDFISAFYQYFTLEAH